MALIGDLRDIKMQDILRFLKRAGKTGILKINGPKKGKIYFKKGKIVNIRSGGKFVDFDKAMEGCIGLLRQTEGEFRLEPVEEMRGKYEIDPDLVVKKMR